MNLVDYDRRLSNHDWYYRESDDSGVARRGRLDEEELQAIAKESAAHEKLHDIWSRYNTYKSNVSREMVDAVRIEVGVTTQAEMDAAEQEERDRENQRVAEQLLALRRYCEIMHGHDWYYWVHRLDSPEYQHGFDVRKVLLEAIRYNPKARLLWKAYTEDLMAGRQSGIPVTTRYRQVRKEVGLDTA
jgi:hypothetical protein